MGIFKKRGKGYVEPVEQKFSLMMGLVKDLPKADYERLKKAMDLGWQSYQTIRNVKTNEEKENADIYEAEKILAKEMEK